MSEQFKGDYAPELFNEAKRYHLLQAQEFVNLTDAELRDMHRMSSTSLRRFIQNQLGDYCALDDGFLIAEGTDNTNNFKITGGDGTLDHPGVAFLKGYRLYLKDDISYSDQTSSIPLTDDGYTETVLPSLTTPAGPVSTIRALSADGTNLIAGGDSTVSQSLDIGRSWTPVHSASGMSINAVSFGDPSTIFAAGSDGTVLKSSDSGSTWTNIQSNLPPSFQATDFSGTFFMNGSSGWIVGESGTILITIDGGVNWVQQGYAVTTNTLCGISQAGLGAWAVGESGTILRTTNVGALWTTQSSGTTARLRAVEALGTNNGIIVGDSSTILLTVNGGAIWASSPAGTSSDLYAVNFPTSSIGYAVGSGGVITKTTDGGYTWDATVLKAGATLRSVWFLDATTGFVTDDSGVILRTVDGVTWDPYRTDYVYLDVHLAEVSADSTSGSEYIDTGLEDSLLGLPSANRLRLVQDVKVSEGWPAPSDYIGPDGTVQHYTFPLASFSRTVGKSVISQSDITDLRPVVRTISELDYALKHGGVDASSIADGAIGPSKIDSSADYTFNSLTLSNNLSVGADLYVSGSIYAPDTSSLTVGNLNVKETFTLGDSSNDGTATLYGQIIQISNVGTAYNLFSDSTSPAIQITSDGSGQLLNLIKNSDSTSCAISIDSTGAGYDICLTHRNSNGGGIIIEDSGEASTIEILRSGQYGSAIWIDSSSLGPTIGILNDSTTPSLAVYVNQTSGRMLQLNAGLDASAVVISSTGPGTDLTINHASTSGRTIDVTSSGSEGALNISNYGGQAVNISQNANATALSVDKLSTGDGRGFEVNYKGSDVGLQINNDGTGSIALHVSHTGDSTAPAVNIFVGGLETGPAFYINKATGDNTDCTGQIMYLWNQGYSQTIEIHHDQTSSTATVLQIDNKSRGLDMSSNCWSIDNSGNFYSWCGDMSAGRFSSTDGTHYLSTDGMWLDTSTFDSSNPGIIGQAYIEFGVLRVSDGTNPAPPIGYTGVQGATGMQGTQGETGPSGGPKGDTGVQGETGPAGGPQGPTGIQGVTGLIGNSGTTGVAGVQGVTGPFGGPAGQTGIQGVTGPQGTTGFGIQGETGVQGDTGPAGGPQGATGLQGSTGIAGETGVAGIQGVTGFQGPTGAQGLTGIQGTTGAGIQGATGVPGSVPLSAYNTVSRYEVVGTSGEEVWLVSSSTVYGVTNWSRSGANLTLTKTSHGHTPGNMVIIRNTNVDYQALTIDSTTVDTFSVTTVSLGDTTGSAAAYSLGFTYAHTGSPRVGGVVYAPTGTHADVQLLSMRIRTGGRAGTTYDVVVPASAINGAGNDTGLSDCYIPDFNVRSDSDSLTAIAATITTNISGSYNTFRMGNLGSSSLSRFLLLHF